MALLAHEKGEFSLLASGHDARCHERMGEEGPDHRQRHKAELLRDFERHRYFQPNRKLSSLHHSKEKTVTSPLALPAKQACRQLLSAAAGHKESKGIKQRNTASAKRRSERNEHPKRDKNWLRQKRNLTEMQFKLRVLAIGHVQMYTDASGGSTIRREIGRGRQLQK